MPETFQNMFCTLRKSLKSAGFVALNADRVFFSIHLTTCCEFVLEKYGFNMIQSNYEKYVCFSSA